MQQSRKKIFRMRVSIARGWRWRERKNCRKHTSEKPEKNKQIKIMHKKLFIQQFQCWIRFYDVYSLTFMDVKVNENCGILRTSQMSIVSQLIRNICAIVQIYFAHVCWTILYTLHATAISDCTVFMYTSAFNRNLIAHFSINEFYRQ